MDNKFLSVEDILVLADKVAETGINGIELEIDGCKLKIEGKKKKQIIAPAPVQTVAAPVAPIAPAAAPAEPTTAEPTAPKAPEAESGTVVKSPIVGTFYAAPAPDKAPFVTVGKSVKKGDVLFIIESMKLMNEILAEQDGVVKKIIANDGQAVEFGEPVLVLE